MQLDSVAKHIVGYLPVVAALLLILWDLLAWRWPLIHQLTHRPRIDGLWKVILQPTAKSHIPAGGNRGPITAYVVVSQSFWSVHVRQLTVESGSRSRAVVWEDRGEADVERLTFLYENDPQPEHRERSQRHLGSCTFSPANLKPKVMTGIYFTDRYTQGLMDLILAVLGAADVGGNWAQERCIVGPDIRLVVGWVAVVNMSAQTHPFSGLVRRVVDDTERVRPISPGVFHSYFGAGVRP